MSTEWRWLKVPRRLSCPLRRMGVPCKRERAEGQRFGHAVVERALAGSHLAALLEQLLHLGMDVEVRGVGGQAFGNALKFVSPADRCQPRRQDCRDRRETAPNNSAADA